MHENDLITRQEAATLLRISLRTLDHLIERGEIPRPVTLGGRRLFYHREQLDHWVRCHFGLEVPEGESAPQQPVEKKRRRGRPRRATDESA